MNIKQCLVNFPQKLFTINKFALFCYSFSHFFAKIILYTIKQGKSMLFIKKVLLGVFVLALFAGSSFASSTKKELVTLENFIKADSTRAYLKELAFNANKVNFIRSTRERTDTDNQDVIRMNDDTLYSRIILDVKGGATISLKKYAGFQNVNVLDIRHSQIASLTGEGTIKVDESMLTEGEHVYVIIRTGLLRALPTAEMMQRAYKAQDGISITYHSSNQFVPSVDYDYATLDTVKYKIFERFAKNPQKYLVRNGFGKVGERDEPSAQTMIAIGWGGLSGKQAVYSPFSGKGEREVFTIDRPNLKFKEGAFFSFTMYNENGWIATKNYAINSDDMIANADGTYTIVFLASGEPIKKGDLNVVRTPRGKMWTGVLRAYHPVEKIESYNWADNWTKKMTAQFMK